MSLSTLINKTPWLLAALVGLAVASGCSRPSLGLIHPSKAGVVNVDVLVRSHPGWGGVIQFDHALTRLEAVDLGTGALPLADPSLKVLPPVPVEVPQVLMQMRRRERISLENAAQAQIAHLRAVRADARERRVEGEQSAWENEAARQYDKTIAEIQADYRQKVETIAGGQDKGLVNLTLQVRALKDLVARWSLSVPPAPRLKEARRQLALKEAELSAATINGDQQIRLADAKRYSAIRAAESERENYIAPRRAALIKTLVVQDEMQLGMQRDRLNQRMAAIQRVNPDRGLLPPTVGDIGPEKLGIGLPSVEAAQPFAKRAIVRRDLLAQRQRWVEFLYDDTRAAVRDAAEANHWSITFGRPRAGEEDLTASMIHQLKMSVWRS